MTNSSSTQDDVAGMEKGYQTLCLVVMAGLLVFAFLAGVDAAARLTPDYTLSAIFVAGACVAFVMHMIAKKETGSRIIALMGAVVAMAAFVFGGPLIPCGMLIMALFLSLL